MTLRMFSFIGEFVFMLLLLLLLLLHLCLLTNPSKQTINFKRVASFSLEFVLGKVPCKIVDYHSTLLWNSLTMFRLAIL